MAEVTPGYLAYVRSAEAEMVPSLRIDFPHATRYFSFRGGVFGGVNHLPWLRSIEGPNPSVAKRPGQIATTEISVTLTDPDGTLVADLESHSSRNSPISLYSASPRLATTDWATVFVGVVDDWQLGSGSVTIVGKPDQRQLLKNVPSTPLLRGDWPYPLTNNPSYGIFPPVVYGVQDSRSTTGTGMIPTICVEYNDTDSRWRYIVSHGWTSAIPRVYSANVLKTLTTDYTLTRVEVGGNLFTLIDWTVAGKPAQADAVTCDVEGFETVGDGSGSTITNPVAQLRHWLTNFVFGSYRRGLWTSSSSKIDSASWSEAETFASVYAFEGSMYIGGTRDLRSAEDVVRTWMGSWLCFRIWWGQDGKLRIGPLSPGNRSPSRTWLREEGHREIPRIERDSSQMIQTVDLSHIYGEVSGRYWATLRLIDGMNTEPAQEQFDLRYSAARTL
jgi:hypothetical protein